MRIIIPAAGIGRRLKPHTNLRPKPLLCVAGRPVLAHLLDQVAPLNPEEIILVVGHLGEQIVSWADKNCRLPYSIVKQETLLGLGYAVWLALDSVPNGPVMILLSDTLIETDLKGFVSTGKNLLGVKGMDDPSAFGVANVTEGKVTRLIEKPTEPTSDLALVGLYYIEDTASLKHHLAEILESDSRTAGEIQLTDALQRMIAGGYEFSPWEVSRWNDCGDVRGLLATNARLLAQADDSYSIAGSLVKPPVYIDREAVIEGSVIGPHVAVAAGVKISNSVISSSVINDGAIIKNTVIKDSLIAENSVISMDESELIIEELVELSSENKNKK